MSADIHALRMGVFDRLRGDDDERVTFLGIDRMPLDLVEDHPESSRPSPTSPRPAQVDG
jgi:hypothetical protein